MGPMLHSAAGRSYPSALYYVTRGVLDNPRKAPAARSVFALPLVPSAVTRCVLARSLPVVSLQADLSTLRIYLPNFSPARYQENDAYCVAL